MVPATTPCLVHYWNSIHVVLRAPDRIRTCTSLGLSQRPLPVGIQKQGEGLCYLRLCTNLNEAFCFPLKTPSIPEEDEELNSLKLSCLVSDTKAVNSSVQVISFEESKGLFHPGRSQECYLYYFDRLGLEPKSSVMLP